MALRHIRDKTFFFHGHEGEWALCSRPWTWKLALGRHLCERCKALARVRRTVQRVRAQDRAQAVADARATWQR